MEESLISAIDALLDYVASHQNTILHADVPELLTLDQEVEALCHETGLSLPSSCGANYGDHVIGFCRIPAVSHSGGVNVMQDQSWFIAMRGLRKWAELRRQRRSDDRRSSANVAAPPLPAEPALTDRQYAVLDALYDTKSFSPDQRLSTSDIAERADGQAADPAGFKDAVAGLRRRGLVQTSLGRGGGAWLTADGRDLVEIQRKR